MERIIEEYNKLVSDTEKIIEQQDGFIWRGRKWKIEDRDIIIAIISSLIKEKK